MLLQAVPHTAEKRPPSPAFIATDFFMTDNGISREYDEETFSVFRASHAASDCVRIPRIVPPQKLSENRVWNFLKADDIGVLCQ